MKVEHDVTGHRFVIQLPDGHGELIYRLPRDGVVELYHTEVDPTLRRQGIGAALVRAAFDAARAEGKKVIVTCPYVAAWLARHPVERDLVVPR
ncbi:MAG: GNAT family N-acetyltransferase [Gemmatimonadales bacterium]